MGLFGLPGELGRAAVSGAGGVLRGLWGGGGVGVGGRGVVGGVGGGRFLRVVVGVGGVLSRVFCWMFNILVQRNKFFSVQIF